ncbi:hypothetical protein NQ317_010740 [Molorchus minor]|uniref:Uncharacterized protein n=1 Tax=Molorchus minor TaxID=1323400 RepID=A0ABQ9JED7_9CUCU|nr:hypothetical protein NQ317_010740 [Molorchus minor]
MMSTKLLVFLSFQVLSVFGLSGNVALNLPEIDLEGLNWQQEQVQTLVQLINTLTQVGNVTLVGWQNVYNSDGSLAQVKTIELAILNQIPSENILSEEEVDVDAELPVVLNLKDAMWNSAGILLSGSIQQWSREGDLENLLVVNQNQDIFVMDSNVVYGLINITLPNTQQITQLAKTLQGQTNIPVSVLRWNVNGQFDMQNSNIVPQLLGTILESENATQSIVDAALINMVQAVLQQPSSALKQMTQLMRSQIQGFNWIATEGLEGAAVDSDVSVKLLPKRGYWTRAN